MNRATTHKTQLVTDNQDNIVLSLQEKLDLTEMFFRHSSDFLAILDYKGNLLQCNPTWGRELGFQKNEIQKENLLKLVYKDDLKKTKDLLKNFKEGNYITRFENRLITINGELVWVRWNLIADKDKKRIFIQGKEITRVKHKEKQLKFQLEFEELISKISNKLLIHPIVCTDEVINESLEMIGEFLNVDRIIFHKVLDDRFNVKSLYGWYSGPETARNHEMNDGFCMKDFPWAYQQLTNTGVFYVPSVDKMDDIHKEEKEFLQNYKVVSYLSTVVTIQDKFQGFLYISTHQYERMWSKDSIALVKILGQVLSSAVQRKEMIDVLKNRTEELERSNKELEQFAYVASHDLKEPLRMIGSYVQLLKKRYQDRFDEDSMEFLSFAVDGVKRMLNLINDLLEYSKIGKKSTAYVSIDLNKIIDIVLLNLSNKIVENNVIIKVKKLPVISADSSQMIQLFQNLLDNAIKFRNHKRPKIEIGYSETESHWHLYVKDNGIGIDPVYRDKIFIIFQRLNSRNIYNGNGIGLSICRRIVEYHGGKIWFESGFGKGSIFHFSLEKVIENEHLYRQINNS